MSLVDKKVSSRFAESKVIGNVKLKLTKNIMDQIEYLHKIVGSVEWSGVLVYKVLEGSIEDHKNMVVEVLEILPMDVGTSGYTEYELDTTDDYTFNNLCDRVMMDPELKVGHIHTHHNMDCFFSGTDTQELHDNAPNHNYYLSLIVNFKDFTKWCAEIAYVGEETQSGTITRRFKGTDGNMVKKIINVEKETSTLYRIPVDIKYETVEPIVELTEFHERVLALNTKKKTFVYSGYNRSGYSEGVEYGSWQKTRDPLRTPVQGNIFESSKKKDLVRVRVNVSEKSIRDFTVKLLDLDLKSVKALSVITKELNVAFLNTLDDPNDETSDLYLETLVDSFDGFFTEHFSTTPTDISREQVVIRIVNILEESAITYPFIKEIIEELKLNYVLE